MGKTKAAESPPSRAKKRILVAAAKMFRSRGFAACTVRELAEEVGILSGSLFHHFKSKDDILFAVMREVIIAMDNSLAEALDKAPDTKSKVHALIRNELEYIHGPNANATAVLVYEWHALSADGQGRLLARRKSYFSRWQAVLDQADSEGLLKVQPTVLRQLLHGSAVWSANWFDPKGSMDLTGLEEAMMAMALK